MMKLPCNALDDYLGKWLGEPERLAFEAHLPGCARCQESLREQQVLTRLLATTLRDGTPVPAGLFQRVEKQLRIAHRRRLAVRITAVAALVALVAGVALGMLALPRSPSGSQRPDVAQVMPATPAANETIPPPVKVVFRPPSSVLATPIETQHRAVTIIWVYPAGGTPQQEKEPLPSNPSDRSGI